MALRPDQVGASGTFGAVPVFAGTLLITAIAMCVSVPVGLLSAIYLGEYATPRTRAAVKPLLGRTQRLPHALLALLVSRERATPAAAVGEEEGVGRARGRRRGPRLSRRRRRRRLAEPPRREEGHAVAVRPAAATTAVIATTRAIATVG